MALHSNISLCCRRLLLRQRFPCINASRTSALTTWKKEQDAFFEKNETLRRPLSPHITIYRFPMTAVLSVCHRGAGMCMYTGLATFGVGMCLVPGDLAQTLALVKSLSYGPALILLLKLGVAWPFSYHSMNGIRHLVWDTARGVDLKSMYYTGYAVVGLSVLLAFGLAMW